MTWKDNLSPASFRGVLFHVDVGAKAGGRRTVDHQYPKRDTPYAEDMGRRGRHFTIHAYVIGPDYTATRDLLEAAMDQEGPGTLVHPTKGTFTVQPDGYSSQESRERGGMCDFELTFLEAGTPGNVVGAVATSYAVNSAATALGTTSASSADQAMGSLIGT